ncbi:MAG TPA: SGNH/GDSL hydrolase family protein [Tepidisphaeraceae bacterium]|nr:SGNH/GDSL hydrolase family protein [Tepidisphaeraceae bacterium]
MSELRFLNPHAIGAGGTSVIRCHSLMPWIVYFIAGGGTFLPGAGLIAVAVASQAIFARRWVGVLSVAMAVVGIVLVAISAEAVAWWIYLIWIACTLAWFLRGISKSCRVKSMIDLAELAVTVWAAAIAISFQLRPTLPPAAFARLYIIGDSVSAGIGSEHGSTWPRILGAEHRVRVIDLSRAGATIADATRHLQSQPLADGLVLLEIGGNDTIGHARADQFGRDLDALAKRVGGPSRQVVMLELPLFPGDNAYGVAQRRVASQYGFVLIPRRYFAQMLAAPGATLDGIHLSEAGHRLMARMVWEMLGPSLRVAAPVIYRDRTSLPSPIPSSRRVGSMSARKRRPSV